jgi:multiple sugar transport system permease protein
VARRAPGPAMTARLVDRHLGLILLLPSLMFFVTLLLYPLGYGLWVSLFRRHLLDPGGTFVGLGNYAWLLGNDEFWSALAHSVVWAGATVSLQLVLGTAAALLLHRPFRGRSLARGLILFPYMTPIVSVVLVWILLYSALYGVLNYLLLQVGLIERPVAWLAHPDTALVSVILVGAWKYFPFVMVMVLARLQVIPLETYEAARVDGAGALGRLLHITLPHIREVLVVVALLRTIWMFNNFELVFLLTGGGPLQSTVTLPILVYEQAFGLYDVGRGSAVAVVMFLFLVSVMLLYFRLVPKTAD